MSCALGTDGSVRCWGSNRFGQLGYGNTDSFTGQTPAQLGTVQLF